MSESSIEWTGKTWNPVVGCQKVSPGCAHCYAERMSNRLAGMARKRGGAAGRLEPYLHVINNQGRWNGTVRTAPEALDEPKSWKRPTLVFVNSMSDLFHHDVPLPFIRDVFRVMADCPRHQFQVLTKRADRLRELTGCLDCPPAYSTNTKGEATQLKDNKLT
ncbi:MAG: phage Gp37/Gp68 family protein [Rhodospirillales bacterium]|nr:phage Gp37/Gp68 family protein [Rhodospirillales bacterium]